jgi:5-methylcytosine-specific restriction enzyme subunit McrC
LANKNIIRVAEFEKLYYDDARPFKQKHWEALCRYQEQQYKKGESGAQFYRILNKGIQFANYVGVIQAGNLTIEILPKTDREKATAANLSIGTLPIEDAQNRQKWHNILLEMLKECTLLKVNHVDHARLNLKSNSILDIYIELFLKHTETILHEGLVKKYHKGEGNKLAMKGQLLFSKNISQNLVHRERFYIRHTEYNRINIYNQLLYKTLCLIPAISSNHWLADKVNRLLLDFPEMPDCKVTPAVFDKLVFDRKTERYKEALLISKMLLLNYRPDITGGNENVIAILFDMNKLWEEFVFRRLKKAAIMGVTVSRQNQKPFWYNKTHDFYKPVKPDIIVESNNKRIVIDTKWKIMTDNKPGDDDLKQMFVYNLLWDAELALLVYPGTAPASHGSYVHFRLSYQQRKHDQEEFYNSCSLVFINLVDGSGKLVSSEPFNDLLEGALK